MKTRAADLYRRIHGEAPSAGDSRGHVRIPSSVTGMGPLLVLEVERDDGRVEQWHFAKPYPVLAFGRVTENTKGRSDLFIFGGSYSLASGKFTARSGSKLRSRDVEQTSSKLPAILDRYRATHGGRNPTQALVANIDVPPMLVPVGHCYAVTYDADKGDGVYPYRHLFESPARPLLCANPQGSQLYFVGGAYTVTRHGIEDAD